MSGQPLLVISVVARRLGVHPQTLRAWERLGLVAPQRSAGGNRRYSEQDVQRLARILELSLHGVNAYGIAEILRLEARLAARAPGGAEASSTGARAPSDR